MIRALLLAALLAGCQAVPSQSSDDRYYVCSVMEIIAEGELGDDLADSAADYLVRNCIRSGDRAIAMEPW